MTHKMSLTGVEKEGKFNGGLVSCCHQFTEPSLTETNEIQQM